VLRFAAHCGPHDSDRAELVQLPSGAKALIILLGLTHGLKPVPFKVVPRAAEKVAVLKGHELLVPRKVFQSFRVTSFAFFWALIESSAASRHSS
jgi:hypothetical protein